MEDLFVQEGTSLEAAAEEVCYRKIIAALSVSVIFHLRKSVADHFSMQSGCFAVSAIGR